MVICIQYITLALSEIIEEDQFLFNVHVFICVLKHTDVNMPLWRVSMWEAAVLSPNKILTVSNTPPANSHRFLSLLQKRRWMFELFQFPNLLLYAPDSMKQWKSSHQSPKCHPLAPMRRSNKNMPKSHWPKLLYPFLPTSDTWNS